MVAASGTLLAGKKVLPAAASAVAMEEEGGRSYHQVGCQRVGEKAVVAH